MTPETVIADTETVCRFIYDDNLIYSVDQRPKPGVFLPMFELDLNRHETSLCHLVCEDARVWQLGCEARPKQTLKARADFTVSVATAARLRCLSSPVKDFPEHAVLIDWPAGKAEQKAIAIAIARNCPAVTDRPALQ